MKLWHLELAAGLQGWDVACGFVIRAETEVDAREIATSKAGDEVRYGDKDVWRKAESASCVELTADGMPGIVLRDFNAG